MELRERVRGCLLGLAVGDAVGTTVEFRPRGTFAPLTDLVGGGPFRLQPGEWTDDTSMALCLAMSLLETGGFDPVDQMERYCRWYRHGYLSSTGQCFDIGTTTAQALRQYEITGEPFSGSDHPRSAGNGCLMRLAPVPLFYFPDRDRLVHWAGESSRTTHGAAECVQASRLFAELLYRALAGMTKAAILQPLDAAAIAGLALHSPQLQAIAAGTYQTKPREDIRGTGYVVESLEAAVWCFATTDTFAAAILTAANLGDDADTTAAICGQLAGAYYGASSIPASWLSRLTWGDQITAIADQLHDTIPA